VSDWKTSELQRQATAKRNDLEALNGYIDRLGVMLAEANEFQDYYEQRITAIQDRMALVGPLFRAEDGSPARTVSPAQAAEYQRLRADLAATERECMETMARRTTTADDGLPRSICELVPGNIVRKRSQIIISRDAVARELAEIEAALTPGQLVQSGRPAAEYTEVRERVAKLRQQVGAAG
jgi:hypothetical protein